MAAGPLEVFQIQPKLTLDTKSNHDGVVASELKAEVADLLVSKRDVNFWLVKVC